MTGKAGAVRPACPTPDLDIDMTNAIFIARQPILDEQREVFGYELLYRGGIDAGSRFDDPNQATQTVIERAYLDWGMERLIGARFGLINADSTLIRRGLHRALPPEGVIVELQEHAPFDDLTIDAIELARREGYHFALDNVTSLEEIERSRALPFCSLVKIDMLATGPGMVPQIVRRAKQLCDGVMVAGEKIETTEQHMVGVAAGLDLFQGYLFARPEVLSRAARPATASGVEALLAIMNGGEFSFDRLERAVAADPTLAFRVLAVVNAFAFGLDRRVHSVRNALEMLGLTQVRHFAVVLSRSETNDVHPALIGRGVARAHLMSRLVDDPDLVGSAYLAGLLSVSDEVYDTPMEELIDELPVDEAIQSALLDSESCIGRLLQVAQACEQANHDLVEHLMPNQVSRVQGAWRIAIDEADPVGSGRHGTTVSAA